MLPEQRILLTVEDISKKFSKDIRSSMYHGMQDLARNVVGFKANYQQLRPREFWALRDISLRLKEGEILGIVGANGSGKTTLMRLIAGIYRLDQGRIRGTARRKVTSIFALRSGMQSLFTGRENIYIKGALYGMSKQQLDDRLDFIVSFSELKDHIDAPFGNYSAGMRARLAYAIALASEPDIFIIDEALAVGDSVFKAKCFEHLKEYVKKPGRGVLFVSNNIRKILKVASRVLVMDKGQIIHRSTDITAALHFYITNCLLHLDEDQRALKLKKVAEYDL